MLMKTMKSIKGVYQNGQVTLEEPITTDGPVEVVVVYEEKALEPVISGKRTLTFSDYDIRLNDPTQRFSREELY